MGKRLIRIVAEAIAKKLPEILNEELNVVLNNGVTLHGAIISYDAVSFQLKDMVLRKHTIQLSDIEKIIIDRVSNY